MNRSTLPFALASVFLLAACSQTVETASDTSTSSTATSLGSTADKVKGELIPAVFGEAPEPLVNPVPVVASSPEVSTKEVAVQIPAAATSFEMNPKQLRILRAADVNASGDVSLSEYIAYHEARMKKKGPLKDNFNIAINRWFQRRDKDLSQTLSPEEFFSFSR